MQIYVTILSCMPRPRQQTILPRFALVESISWVNINHFLDREGSNSTVCAIAVRVLNNIFKSRVTYVGLKR